MPFSLPDNQLNFMENFSPLPFALPELHAVASSGSPAKPKHRLDNTKRKGELSEAAFLLKAASLGFGVAKPWGDSERYDFILDSHNDDSYSNDPHDSYSCHSERSEESAVPKSTVAPSLSRSLRQGGDFDLATPSSHATTLSSRAKQNLSLAKDSAKSRDLAFPPRLWRVQLKCTDALRARGYDVQPIYCIYGQGKRVYTANDIDVLVAHIVPVDVWYVLPVNAFSPCKSLRFYPDAPCKRARFEHFREAWHLLR
ncbi:MAG TPA: group I intron-associated PD-(D/E)XK endonuclease [Terriglobales bacterium]